MKKTILLATATFGLTAIPVQAQVPTMGTASYAGQYEITSNGQPPLYAVVKAKPGKQRMEMNTAQGTMITILDMTDRSGFSYNADPNSSMGNMAISVNFDQFEDYIGPDSAEAAQMTEIGSSVVAGHVCTLYQHPEGSTACVTADGILMKTYDANGGMEMKTLTRGFQSDSLFTLPSGYQVMNINGMMGGGIPGMGTPTGTPETDTQTPSTFQTILEDEAEKQTKNEIRKQTQKQMGNTVGGAIGGGALGGAIGGEAGKAAKGLVGGLFGKKKKKKKDEEKAE